MKICTKCGSVSDDRQKFCSECGNLLPESEAKETAVAEPVQEEPVQEEPVQEEPVTVSPSYEPAAAAPSYQDYQKPRTEPQFSAAEDQPKTTNGLCIAALITSLVSIIFLGFTAGISLILSIIGLIAASKKKQKGKGMAIAGIIISVILCLAAVGMIYVLGRVITEPDLDIDGSSTRLGSSRLVDDDDDIDYSDFKREIPDQNWVETNDESYLTFKSGKQFVYYKDIDVDDDYYYEGSYEIYIGDEAVDYITNDLEDYGVTDEELEGLFDRNKKYDEENLICLVLNNETCMIGGENTMKEPVTAPYYGFILVDGDEVVLDIANMNTGTYFNFVPESDYKN